MRLQILLTLGVFLHTTSGYTIPRKGAWQQVKLEFSNIKPTDSEEIPKELDLIHFEDSTERMQGSTVPEVENDNESAKRETGTDVSVAISNDVENDVTVKNSKPNDAEVKFMLSLLQKVILPDVAEDILPPPPTPPTPDPLFNVCQTPECLKTLHEYMLWREQNGYPSLSGRWGK